MHKYYSKIAVVTAVVMLCGAILSGFTRISGIGNVYYGSSMEIFDGVTYTKVLAGNDANGVERAHIITANTEGGLIKPVVFSGDSSSRYVLDTMVNTLEAIGYGVVAGINGDLFSTDTGCPRGLTIHDGIIYSSGYDPQFVITFDDAGKAEMTWTNVNYGLNTQIFLPQEDGTYYASSFNTNIGYFNVPHGGSKSLHLYNRTYGPSTKTTGKNVEVVLDAPSYNEAMLRFGVPIRATVAWIQYEGANTPIGDNQLVLSTAADSATAESLRMMAPGLSVEIYATDMDRGPISRSSECIGMYMLVYHNGSWLNPGTNPNPRTMLGIKSDGTIMMYVLDGRQPGYSSGLGLTDAASHMIALGCVTVANLDGGGSSTIAVREPGRDSKAVVKNSPSDGSQRPIANGLFLVYKRQQAPGSGRLSVYQDNYLAMPGADVQLFPYITNGLYERSGQSATGVTYELIGGDGTVNAYGYFTAGERAGLSRIRASTGDMSTDVIIETVSDINYVLNRSSILTDPGAVTDIQVTASHGYAPVAQRANLFKWECDEHIGFIDQQGVFTAADRTGVAGNIRVSYLNKMITIPVQIGAQITFSDLLDEFGEPHWAKSYIESLANVGMVNGIEPERFAPDMMLTRAQFLTMLAKTINNLDVSAAPFSGFEDVPDYEWYYNYVNWGYATGVVKGVDETRFEPDSGITREQMTVMLNNFAVANGIYLPYSVEAPGFTDENLISDWSIFAVDKIVSAGIMNGMPEGNFDPLGSATRAQAAKVTYVLNEIRSTYPQPPPGSEVTRPGEPSGSDGGSGEPGIIPGTTGPAIGLPNSAGSTSPGGVTSPGAITNPGESAAAPSWITSPGAANGVQDSVPSGASGTGSGGSGQNADNNNKTGSEVILPIH